MVEIFFQIEKKTSYSKNSAFVAMQQALTPPPSKIKYNTLFRGEILEYNRSRLGKKCCYCSGNHWLWENAVSVLQHLRVCAEGRANLCD